MRNVKDWQKKTCIFVEGEEFRRIMKEYHIDVTFSYEGVIFEDQNNFGEIVEDQRIHDILQDYYGVQKVTSVHIDDCYVVGVWICYKDE